MSLTEHEGFVTKKNMHNKEQWEWIGSSAGDGKGKTCNVGKSHLSERKIIINRAD